MIPKGIRIRPTPDWFANYFSTAGFAVPRTSGLNDFQQITLFNNATAGQSLFIWSISAATDQSDYFLVGYVTAPLGTLQQAGVRINPTIGAPPGQVFWSHDPVSPIPTTATSYFVEFDPPGMGGNGPLYVVPPAMGIQFSTSTKCAETVVNWWYLPMVDVKGWMPA